MVTTTSPIGKYQVRTAFHFPEETTLSLQINRALILLTLSLPLTQAANLTYDLTFGPASDGGAAPTGSFTYDTTNNTFVRFDVAFRGLNFNMVNAANGSGPELTQSCPTSNPLEEPVFAAFTNCSSNIRWASTESDALVSFLILFRNSSNSANVYTMRGFRPRQQGSDPILNGPSTNGEPVTATAAVPEPTAALPLLLSLGWLAHRRKRK